MAEFHFEAVDRSGTPVSGEMEAVSEHAVAAQLEQRGMQIVKISLVSAEPETASSELGQPEATQSASTAAAAAAPAQGRISAEDMHEVVGRVADITRMRLPLSSGLRALSDEVPSARVKRTLLNISNRLDAGEPIESVIQNHGSGIPRTLRGVIDAGLKNGNLSLVLEEYLRYTRSSVDLRRGVAISLGYPIILLATATMVCGAFMRFVIPDFKNIFKSFGTELPVITQLAIAVSDLSNEYGLLLLSLLAGFLFAGWLIVTVMGGRAFVRRAIHAIPIVGTLFQAPALARFCHLLALLVRSRTPLADAIRMAGAGANDANLYDGSLRLAAEIEEGVPLEEAARVLPHFPPSIVQLFRWEKREEAFPEVLHAAGEVYEARTKIQTGLIGIVFEPIVLVGVSIVIGGSVIAMFMPLIKLLNDLS